jgi:ElaB/YqjD/DUF883 family membrane-anchored ribosome-binding protein
MQLTSRRAAIIGGISLKPPSESVMNNKTQEQGFDRAVGEAKRQATSVADVATTAARKTAGSFETAAREIIENQPYTAVGIALGIGWFLGRMHRPF